MHVQDALARPESYPDAPTQVSVRETHISWVFLAGEFAYKLKKPLVLDFLDYGTPERRRWLCEEEVRLNRRLAPDLYLGVRGVTVADGKAELVSPEDPRAVDFVVQMRRYEEGDTLASRLARGELTREQIRRVGKVLAAFHARAEPIWDIEAPVLAVERRFEENLHELLALVEQRAEIGRVQAVERFAHAFLTAHAGTFQRRVTEGWIREGHGDLRAEHVIVDGTVQIVDCVEFDPDLRRLDVADDLAFLVLDLAARGGAHLGQELVRAYREAGGNAGQDHLISFFAAYRALVRAKVALLRAAQLPRASASRARESANARGLIAAAERFAWQGRLPLVIAVCGVPASGKTYLASTLAPQTGLPHVSSDLARKRLAGVRSTERAPAEAYSVGWNRRTYSELGRRAADALDTIGGVIVDATFRHAEDRRAFVTGLGREVPILFVECLAPRTVLAARAARRERSPRRVSDANLAVVVREAESWEPLDEIPAQAHLALRTDRPVEAVVGDLMALLDRRLGGGVNYRPGQRTDPDAHLSRLDYRRSHDNSSQATEGSDAGTRGR
ncbi:MAG TPA: AAA family ATPase [Solirubrobacteraceae bacterium]|nr:AAA family ATPase [Solirubrobacteraceae bacterium]